MNEKPKRVLFVCIGNSCRSQMAEAFARAYGSNVIEPASAGLHPATRIAQDTTRAMLEKNLDLSDHFPKHVRQIGLGSFDLIVNMSGARMPSIFQAPVREWSVKDPVSLDYEQHCQVRDEIERLVMNLVLELRRLQRAPVFRGQGSGPVKP